MMGGNLPVENPADNIVLIFEMVVKSIAADVAMPGNQPHGNLLKFHGLQKGLYPLGNSFLGKGKL